VGAAYLIAFDDSSATPIALEAIEAVRSGADRAVALTRLSQRVPSQGQALRERALVEALAEPDRALRARVALELLRLGDDAVGPALDLLDSTTDRWSPAPWLEALAQAVGE